MALMQQEKEIITKVEYPRCRNEEMQKHIIQYPDNQIKRVEFIYQLEQKLPRVNNNQVMLEEIVMIISNIRTYLIKKRESQKQTSNKLE